MSWEFSFIIVTALTILSNGDLVSGSDDKIIKIWETGFVDFFQFLLKFLLTIKNFFAFKHLLKLKVFLSKCTI